MSQRRAFSAQASARGRFSELLVEHFASDVQLAGNHVLARNRGVGQFLCYLSLIRSHGLVPAKAACQMGAAEVQDFNSKDERQAAHCMPGQVLVDLSGGRRVAPWELVKDAGTREKIGALFSRVQNLPANFNKADSYAEKYAKPAIKEIFRDACNEMLAGRPAPAGQVSVPAVRAAYQGWIDQSVCSYRFAINRKIDIAELDDLPQATAPGLNDQGVLDPHLVNPGLADLYERAVHKKGSVRSSTIWDYSEQTRILGYYLRFSEGSILGEPVIRDIQATFRP
jgi:hypothetical protein